MDNEKNYYISASIKLSSKKEESEFLKNGIPLTKSEEHNDKPIDTFAEFKPYITYEVSRFINRSFDNIIILAGAGASVVLSENDIDPKFGKTVFMLAKVIYDDLKEDSEEYSLVGLSKKIKYDVEVEIEDDDGLKKLNKEFNLEDFLSNVITYENYVSKDDKNKYRNTKDKIFKLIKENTSYAFDKEKLKHGAFINKLSKKVKSPSKLTIVTTNYDTLFEEAAENLGFTVMDGFSFSHKPYFDSNMFDWNLVKDIENVKTNELEYKRNILSLLKLHGSLTWERDHARILRKDKSSVVSPIMIFPSSNKYMQSYQEPYFELFTKFQELLKRPNTLLITTGFSFMDTHISKMITQAIKHNKGLSTLVSDYDISQNTYNWKELLSLMNDNYQIAFLKATMNSDLTDYLGDDDVDR